MLQGSAAACTAKCVNNGNVSTCTSGDSCCPSGCQHNTDTDCPIECSTAGAQKCTNSTTLATCTGGAWVGQNCSAVSGIAGSNCFTEDLLNGGKTDCGCKKVACSCSFGDVTTPCGNRGIDEQVDCTSFGGVNHGPCVSGDRCADGFKPPYCP